MVTKTEEMPIEDELKLQVNELVSEERELALLEHDLMNNNPQFTAFLQKQKSFQEKSALYWKSIEDQMIKHSVKSIKGPWGSLTIAERTNYKAADINDVPAKFIKKALDTTKISAQYKLSGSLPKGVESSQSLYLMKRIKLNTELEQGE